MHDPNDALTRRYFHARFASAARQVVARGISQKGQTPDMASVVRVNLQEALSCLKVCPVCGSELRIYIDYPLERTCSCGDFTITEVWSTGEVVFQFKMSPMEPVEAVEDVENIGVREGA